MSGLEAMTSSITARVRPQVSGSAAWHHGEEAPRRLTSFENRHCQLLVTSNIQLEGRTLGSYPTGGWSWLRNGHTEQAQGFWGRHTVPSGGLSRQPSYVLLLILQDPAASFNPSLCTQTLKASS